MCQRAPDGNLAWAEMMQPPTQEGTPGSTPGEACRSDPSPLFPSAITDPTLLDRVTLPGAAVGGSPARSYLFAHQLPNGTHAFVPVIAPANGTVTTIIYYQIDASQYARAEYEIVMQVSCEVEITFAHVAHVAGAVAAAAPATPSNSTAVFQNARVVVHAGEQIGDTNGTLTAGSWDFLVMNRARPVAHVNASRWQWDPNRFGDCGYAYFPQAVHDAFVPLFASSGGTPITGEACRTPARDVAGTLAGGWFRGASTDLSGEWIELVSEGEHEVDLVQRHDNGAIYTLRDTQPAALPENVQVGGFVCWSSNGGYAAAQLVDASTMRLARGSGACPTSMPAEAETWSR